MTHISTYRKLRSVYFNSLISPRKGQSWTNNRFARSSQERNSKIERREVEILKIKAKRTIKVGKNERTTFETGRIGDIRWTEKPWTRYRTDRGMWRWYRFASRPHDVRIIAASIFSPVQRYRRRLLLISFRGTSARKFRKSHRSRRISLERRFRKHCPRLGFFDREFSILQ